MEPFTWYPVNIPCVQVWAGEASLCVQISGAGKPFGIRSNNRDFSIIYSVAPNHRLCQLIVTFSSNYDHQTHLSIIDHDRNKSCDNSAPKHRKVVVKYLKMHTLTHMALHGPPVIALLQWHSPVWLIIDDRSFCWNDDQTWKLRVMPNTNNHT